MASHDPGAFVLQVSDLPIESRAFRERRPLAARLRPLYIREQPFPAKPRWSAYSPGCVKTQNATPRVEPIASFVGINARSGNRISFYAPCRKLILTNLGERAF